MSAEVNIPITADDEASDVFSQIAASYGDMTSDIEDDSSQMDESINGTASATQNLSSSIQVTTANTGSLNSAASATDDSMGSQLKSMNSSALSAASLGLSIYSIESAQTSLNRAQVTAEKDANAVTVAQQAYVKALDQYGPMAQETTDAQNKLSLAQQASQVAGERLKDSQNSYNQTLIMAGFTAIPAVVNGFSLLSKAGEMWNTLQEVGAAAAGQLAVATGSEAVATGDETMAQWLLNAAMDAFPVFAIIAGIAALAAGFVWAYQNVKPFRDIINDIASIIKGYLIGEFEDLDAAGKVLWSGMQWAYNNVLQPIGNFFAVVLKDAIMVVMAPIQAFEAAISKVAAICKPLTDFIGDLGNALRNLCFAHAAPAAEEYNRQVSQSLTLSDSLSRKTELLGNNLRGLATGMKTSGGGTGTTAIRIESPQIKIGAVTGTASMDQVTTAAMKGMLNALYKTGLTNKSFI